MDISSAIKRQSVLKSIKPVEVMENHQVILEILKLEITDWRQDDGPEIKENLFHCGFLLHIVGDYKDVELMCEARNINLRPALFR